MQFLIRSARIVDTASSFDGQVVDILVDNGLIRQIGENLSADTDTPVIESDNLHVSSGWVDMRVLTQDPGYEHKEDLTSVCRAAAAGGFTDIAVLPNTQPVVDDKGTLGYVRRMAEGQPVTVHAIAAVTKKGAGEDFTEMLDLHQAGAVAFSDGTHPLQNPDLLLKTLQYLQPINGLLMNRPEEQLLTRFGQMHEGIQSTLLGLKGLPALAEELMIERDLRLLDYVLGSDDTRQEVEALSSNNATAPAPTLSALHFSTISSARSVELIRQAKAAGAPVSCDVAVHQLVFDDSALASFDTNLKVNPPFRSAADVEALWAGLADGTIDAIVSDHSPQDAESKNLEFDQAEFGITGLETVFSVLITHNRNVPLAQLIEKLTVRPREILRLPAQSIAEGQFARLTLFDPTKTWVYERTFSKSKNSPFLGQSFTGCVIGTVHQGQLIRTS
ncbi:MULTISPECIES: dihydroorotase [unclassified Spirosoma]|uniref:dihydroorotase n=1 Tax=unclassified Spirosoma TaxID=2621999 RepID=UPI00095DCFD9|nr:MULTISPECIES: dihydroorotase [unclassified Spirosoma]MBN8824236.1 dihydroorotase [Spirosoma sp.]OJW79035.1 MAG: dihydroorotase [Spirosoma sp. 48-14]